MALSMFRKDLLEAQVEILHRWNADIENQNI